MPNLYLYLRFSTKSQENGNSVKRQTEFGAKYAEREKLTLDRTFGDEGVSGHKGRHHHGNRAGGLAEFLSLCRSGEIPRGSFLLVESFDRLSREHPLDAMELLRQLLNDHGVVLVVMRPEMRLTGQTLGQLEGIMAFIEALRAYGESARKSDLSRYNWEEKRKKAVAGTEIVGSRVPGWCLVEDGKIKAHPEHKKTVQLIFELCRKGLGQELICQELIKRNISAFNRSGRWYAVYVRKVLNSRTVLGEWHPRMLVNGKLVPVGDQPIKGYYPEVVTEDEWKAARAATLSRHRRNGKPSVKAVNLFTSLVYVGGQPVVFRSKDAVKYYCPTDLSNPGVKLEHVERCLLYWLYEVKLTLKQDDGDDVLRLREAELANSARKLKTKIKANPSLVDMTETVLLWEAELAEVRKKLEASAVPMQSSFLRSQALIEKLRASQEDERIALRRELRQSIRFIIDRIDIGVAGEKFKAKKVDIMVTMRDGTQRGLYYETDGNRITACGLLYATFHDKNLKSSSVVENFPAFVCDPAPFRRRGMFSDRGPGIVATVDEMKAKVRELHATGLSAPKIGEQLQISRWTVYNYLKS